MTRKMHYLNLEPTGYVRACDGKPDFAITPDVRFVTCEKCKRHLDACGLACDDCGEHSLSVVEKGALCAACSKEMVQSIRRG